MEALIAKLDTMSWPGAFVAVVLVLAIAWVLVTFIKHV